MEYVFELHLSDYGLCLGADFLQEAAEGFGRVEGEAGVFVELEDYFVVDAFTRKHESQGQALLGRHVVSVQLRVPLGQPVWTWAFALLVVSIPLDQCSEVFEHIVVDLLSDLTREQLEA